ncbi:MULTISPECIES: hypothetical protein [unclassified Streptomyces]|uniref:hypothetical protein n=1 Tax=unclassified Streptomyces TaxID=2593676 RepID=UPI001F046B17|nr:MULTISPECIES: hypothetical protein [unclassified Streptomyces]MCH0566196.1 hypothetical protein [Streptomyces sp. MUM 2J]MCH0572026.1 hypothetical protein [Streptomyces sp. MUM 136J]
MTGMGVEAGAQAARSRALAVLRVRGRAVAVALLPAAAAVILLAGGSTGHLTGPVWGVARWAVSACALLVLLAAGGVALVVARARPAVSPTVPVREEAAPDLYRMVRDLADRLDVPAPSAIALTPDCDSWLEDRAHAPHDPASSVPRFRQADDGGGDLASVGRDHAHRRTGATVLVIGSPFLWWMRVGELRAVLAPVVAGTEPSAHPDIAAARRFVRGLDAAVAVAATPGRCPLTRPVCAGLGWTARLLLRSCRGHAVEMERGVASAAAERAQAVDYGLRIVAQEQVGLAYAGWDRLLTRVALPAWRMGRWPARLDAGVVAALTELSRRDRLAEGFASRLGERPACDLLEEPGVIDEATSLLAARLFHGGPAEAGPDWSPVDWQDYPEEVVDRKWRSDAARLHRVLDTLGVRRTSDQALPAPSGPTLTRVLDHLAAPAPAPVPTAGPAAPEPPPTGAPAVEAAPVTGAPVTPEDTDAGASARAEDPDSAGPSAAEKPASPARVAPAQTPESPAGPARATHAPAPADRAPENPRPQPPAGEDPIAEFPSADDAFRDVLSGDPPGMFEPPAEIPENPRTAALAEGLAAELAREEAAGPSTRKGGAEGVGQGPDTALWDDGALPLFPLQPPRTPRELLADHVAAMVCCAAMDTAGAAPGLDWLDGPTLLIDGERAADLTPRVLSLTEDGDPVPLREWLTAAGIRPEKPVRLV